MRRCNCSDIISPNLAMGLHTYVAEAAQAVRAQLVLKPEPPIGARWGDPTPEG